MRDMTRVDLARVTAALVALVAVLAMHGLVNLHHVPTSLAAVHPAQLADHVFGHDVPAPLLVVPTLIAAGGAHPDRCDDCPSHVHAALLLCVAALAAAGCVLALTLAARAREAIRDRGSPQMRRLPTRTLRARHPDLLTELCISRT